MYKQPLFGEDSSPHITSLLLSSIITLVCWIIFCVLCFVIKFKPQTPQYKEVQIVLSSTPVVAPAVPEPVEGQAESVPAAAMQEEAAVVEPVETTPVPELPKPVETPVAAAKVEAPKKQAAPATTPKAKETPADKKVSYDIVKSVDELMEEQLNAKKQTAVPDWFYEDDDVIEESAVSQKVDKVTTTSSISGSAASTSNYDQRKTSTSSISPSQNSGTSDGLSERLEQIRDTTATSSNSGSSSNPTDTQKFSSDLDIAWDNGVVRKQKGSLSINLSTGSSVKEKKTTVKIEFIVGEDGYITPGSVKIIPESLLPENVRKEVVAQVNLWRFNEAPYRSKAVFDYTIIRQD